MNDDALEWQSVIDPEPLKHRARRLEAIRFSERPFVFARQDSIIELHSMEARELYRLDLGDCVSGVGPK